MKLIYSSDNILILHSIRSLLDQHNIDAFIKNEESASMGVRFGIGNLFVELWLRQDSDFEQAKAIIDTHAKNADPQTSWVCQQCSEKNEGNFEICWQCQTPHQS